ncbi:MAG: DUF4430 domain-containing protein [Patescibacteria group bacterium]|nr:DUF4430 domain-containing protein [Patescibacteria group bacterium]
MERGMRLFKEYWLYCLAIILMLAFLAIYLNQNKVLGENTETTSGEVVAAEEEVKSNKEKAMTQEEPKIAKEETKETSASPTTEKPKRVEETEKVVTPAKKYITFRADGLPEYAVEYIEGDTAFTVMLRLAATKNVTVGYKQYDFGKMVTQIGDKKAEDTYYWALYVNGGYAIVGVEDLAANDGDVIEWRYESWM